MKSMDTVYQKTYFMCFLQRKKSKVVFYVAYVLPLKKIIILVAYRYINQTDCYFKD